MSGSAPTRETIVVPGRFNGPPGSGNCGYVSGRMARYVQGPASVRLRSPAAQRPFCCNIVPSGESCDVIRQ